MKLTRRPFLKSLLVSGLAFVFPKRFAFAKQLQSGIPAPKVSDMMWMPNPEYWKAQYELRDGVVVKLGTLDRFLIEGEPVSASCDVVMGHSPIMSASYPPRGDTVVDGRLIPVASHKLIPMAPISQLELPTPWKECQQQWQEQHDKALEIVIAEENRLDQPASIPCAHKCGGVIVGTVRDFESPRNHSGLFAYSWSTICPKCSQAMWYDATAKIASTTKPV